MATGSKEKRNFQYDILEPLKFRFSPFRFQEKKISVSHLKSIFEAARWTPSAKNLQPWSFVQTVKGSKPYLAMIDCLTDKNRRWADKAPMLILSLYDRLDREGEENFYALHDLGSPVSNMTLQAHELGIAFHLIGGPELKQTRDLLEIPERYSPVNIIAAGYYCLDNEPIDEDYN